ncbi:MAG TPA: TetR/AcrR family transcriptional regulator [Thermomonospora sp.]|nr:TetR/AcrR family transcriptional regulator [Thermomonospora sp.]
MGSVKTRREQYAESTRRALLDTGLRFFAERGHTDVSAEELVRAAGLTRGALYHHFNGKKGLFEAVFEELEDRAAQRIATAMDTAADPWSRALAGLEAFLDVCGDRDYREIVLIQGPVALGWQRWRELDQRHLGGLLLRSLCELREERLIGSHPVELAAGAVYGALTELSFAIAASNDPAKARDAAVPLVRGLLQSLR